MATPIIDPTFQPGCYIFGYTVPGLAYWGNARTYPQQAIFGLRAFGGEIPGKNTEEDVFQFRYGAPVPRATGPWPVTSDMSIRHRGAWAKRIIFYTWRGQQRVRRYTPYHGSPKDYLMPWALKLMEASFIWHLFDDDTKRRLNSDASRLGLKYAGYHYFTKLYMKDDPHWQDYV